MLELLQKEPVIIIKQLKEFAEVLGFETRNKYGIYTEDGRQLGFAAEQQKGLLGFFMRQIFGHWRSFDIHIFDNQRTEQIIAHHPFRFYFQCLKVREASGRNLGYLEKQFSILSKKFTVFDESQRESCRMHSGLFRIWTFPFMRDGKEIARISKKWGGAMTEIFMDADTFRLEFLDPALRKEERAVLMSAAILVDLLYFENNQGARMNIADISPI